MTVEVSASAPVSPRRSLWWLGGLILGLGIVAQGLLLLRFAEDPTYSKMSVLFVWPATLFALLLWWLLAVRVSWRIKLAPLAAIGIGLGTFFSLYRVEGSDGDMVPIIVSRWAPTRAEVAREYWKQQSIATTTAPQTTDDAQGAVPETPAEPLVAGPDDWPDFRGPLRDGIIRGTGFRTDWDANPPRELWRHPVGLGWSSFAVLGDLAITMEQRDDMESVVCYRLSDGEPIWIHGDSTRFTAVAVNGGDGPHATPVIDGDRTFTLGATGLLNCLETRTGRSVWQRNILVDGGDAAGNPVKNLEWGISGTPLVIDGLVIAVPGGASGKSVIAYHRETGDIAWSSADYPATYGAPRVDEFAGTRQLVALHGLGVAGFELDSGRQLWNFPWQNMPKVNVAQVVKVSDSSFVLGIGYGVGAVRVNLNHEAENWSTSEGWKSPRFKLKFNDAVLLNGHLFGLDDGILTCLHPETGKTLWKARRMGYGQLLGFADTLLILSEEGEVVLAEANPQKFVERGRLKVLEGTTWNHPVVAHGKLLVRNGTAAACYDVAP